MPFGALLQLLEAPVGRSPELLTGARVCRGGCSFPPSAPLRRMSSKAASSMAPVPMPAPSKNRLRSSSARRESSSSGRRRPSPSASDSAAPAPVGEASRDQLREAFDRVRADVAKGLEQLRVQVREDFEQLGRELE